MLLANVGAALALVVAVVPFGQVGFDQTPRTQARQFASLSRAQAGAHENPIKLDLAKARGKCACLILAVCGQAEVGPSRVLAGERPRRFTVSNEVQLQR